MNLLSGGQGGLGMEVPQWGSGAGLKLPKAGNKYGCRLYRNTMKITKTHQY